MRKTFPAYAIDIMVIALGTCVVAYLSGTFDFYSRAHEWILQHDNWKVDEIVIICTYLLIAMGAFSVRRWRESRASLAERDQSLDDLRIAKEHAEQANRTKSDFLANMSHEIRTPMNAIIGMTDLALDSELSEEQREQLEMVLNSAQSLMHLLNEVLDFSKIEAGKLEIDREEVELRSVAGDVVKTFGARAHEKGLELACRVSPLLPDVIEGDALRLRQVLVNLVGNAIKFTEEGEVVVSVDCEKEGDDELRIHCSVRDTGIGISPQHQRLIFDAFTQADSSSTRRFGGTGLGLAISTRLVSLMGGHLWLDSEVGRGTTFHFTALLGMPDITTERPEKPAINLQGLSVLIVDDNATNRLILEEAVTSWGMHATCVDNGRQAIETLRSTATKGDSFTLVLLDAMMPGMDGFSVAEEIKADPTLAGATVMMLSSADCDGDAARCREVGIVRYLRKPITPTALRDTVAVSLGRAPVAKPQPKAAPGSQETAARPLNILLAEDNVVNQRVAMGILSKRGHIVQVANNGQEALDAIACQRFDLILMDVQMPVMDGLKATAAIRELQLATKERTPIIAMTAHAMKGDRERFLDGGMDDYLSKPIEPKVLHEIVERWSPQARAAHAADNHRETMQRETWPGVPRETVPAAAAPKRDKPTVDVQVFDLNSMRDRVEDDLDLLQEMVELFLSSSPDLMEEIEAAVMARDGQKIANAAHTLRGVLKNMCATSCAEAAHQLEAIAAQNDLAPADQALCKLKYEFEHLETVLIGVPQELKA
jgi:signal transduction histidine kinase/CheY-like chemotaxis protein/HPt (histidine-containing phosphotransfer) domain-containing protein